MLSEDVEALPQGQSSLMVVPTQQGVPVPQMPQTLAKSRYQPHGSQSSSSAGVLATMPAKKSRFAWMAVCGGAQRRREAAAFEKERIHQEQIMSMQAAGYAAGSGFAQAGQLAQQGIQSAGSDIRSGLQGAGMDVREGIVAAGEHFKSGLVNVGENVRGGITTAGQDVREGLVATGKGVETAGDQVRGGIQRAGTSVEQGVKKHGDTIYDGMIAISNTCIWVAVSFLISALGYTSMWWFMSKNKDTSSVDLGGFSFRWSVGLCTAGACMRCLAPNDLRWVTASWCILGWAGLFLIFSGFSVVYYVVILATQAGAERDMSWMIGELAGDHHIADLRSTAYSSVVAGLLSFAVFGLVPAFLRAVFRNTAATLDFLQALIAPKCGALLEKLSSLSGSLLTMFGRCAEGLLWVCSHIGDAILCALKAATDGGKALYAQMDRGKTLPMVTRHSATPATKKGSKDGKAATNGDSSSRPLLSDTGTQSLPLKRQGTT